MRSINATKIDGHIHRETPQRSAEQQRA